ncbi:hypothetical protein M885DRAFT_512791 [Pelagophyceae sp. CCMP2097]|nr:hypothetical protein M885DRAFT_512791 [Pelagophyceae sp. CCMP2097]|mmetsp:Transcript_32506/g.112447  ORF Transcript_32506/g.112447 Transcript_32506/m.112447 type:complete len:175 (-) Transcript_32506:28-552(-)
MPGTVESARLSAASHAAASGVAIIGAEALMGLGENAVVVDVRTLAERLVARIPRSYSAADFEAADPEICRNKTVVVVCTVGRRSGAYAARLLDRGGVWNAVLNSEGIVSYSHAEAAYGSGPFALVDAAGQPANALHCYAAPWDHGSPRFKAVRFGPAGAVLAAAWPALLDRCYR